MPTDADTPDANNPADVVKHLIRIGANGANAQLNSVNSTWIVKTRRADPNVRWHGLETPGVIVLTNKM